MLSFGGILHKGCSSFLFYPTKTNGSVIEQARHDDPNGTALETLSHAFEQQINRGFPAEIGRV
jgi:hypothetical protein